MRASCSWRKTWSHIIEAARLPLGRPAGAAQRHLEPGLGDARLDPERCNGVSGSEPERRVLLREKLERVAAKSTPSFPPALSGL